MKSNLHNSINNLCEFICCEFGSEAKSFVFNRSTLLNLLNQKELEDSDYLYFCSEMSNHGYGTIIANDIIFLIHISLLSSFGEVSEENINLKFIEFNRQFEKLEVDNKHIH